MDVRTFLGGISTKKAMAREYSAKIEAAEAGLLPRGLRYDKESVQSSGANDRVERIFDTVEDLRAAQMELVAQYTADEALAVRMLSHMEDAREARVLSLYYLGDGRDTFEDVADVMGYSERQIFRIYQSAIQHIQDIADKMS